MLPPLRLSSLPLATINTNSAATHHRGRKIRCGALRDDLDCALTTFQPANLNVSLCTVNISVTGRKNLCR